LKPLTIGATFGLDYSQLSRVLKIFNRHIMLDNFSELLTNNLEYWVDHFPTFAQKISAKLAEKGDIHYPEGSLKLKNNILF
jgi:hypothetical protein